VVLRTEGGDEKKALDELGSLINDGFHEE